MSRQKLRNSIALEAARLMLRGKETDYRAARKRATRWLSRRKVAAADMPTAAEIQTQLYALSGLFAEEHQAASLSAMRAAAIELMTVLEAFQPHVSGCAVDGTVTAGATIALDVRAASVDEVTRTLAEAGFRSRATADDTIGDDIAERLILNHGFPCEIIVIRNGSFPSRSDDATPRGRQFCLDELRELVETSSDEKHQPAVDEQPVRQDDEYHPDAFASFEILLGRLEQVQLDPVTHPEGDALYHSLQVFELGVDERPYDEEFLLACLLHDAGLAFDRREPVGTLLRLLGNLLTERTRFLIENLSKGNEFLATGRAPRSLRRSEDFDDLVLLARCDRDGRVCGAEVRDLADVLDYIEAIDGVWDVQTP